MSEAKPAIQWHECMMCKLQNSPDGATHIVAEDAKGIPESLTDEDIVSARWLEGCIAVQKLLPVKDYIIEGPKGLPPNQSNAPQFGM